MKVGDTEVRVPAEDPVGYALDWRWRLASKLAESCAVAAAVADADVRKLAAHLKARARRRAGLQWKSTAFDRVIAWRESGTGMLVEVLLAASSTRESVAADLNLAADDVGFYGKYFFDIHDAEGTVRRPVLMRLRMEVDAREADDARAKLMKIALTAGPAGLRQFLQPASESDNGEQNLDSLVEAELKRRLVAGELRTGDLVRLQANAIARDRLARDAEGGSSQQLVESLDLVRSILSLTEPKMVRPDTDEERTAATTQAIQGRFAAHQNAASATVDDIKSKGEAALNMLINGNLKDVKPDG